MAYLSTLASANNRTAGTAIDVTTTSSIPADTLLFMVIGADNTAAAAPQVSSFTNVVGGVTWTLVPNASVYSTGTGTAAGDGTVGHVYYGVTTSVVNTATRLATVNFSASTVAKAINVVGFSETINPVFSGNAVTGTSTAGTPTATDASPVAGNFVIGAVIGENNAGATGDADTTNGTWSTISSISSSGGSAATNVTVGIQFKKVTATGSQTYNPTTANDSAVIIFDFIGYMPITASGASTSITSDIATRQTHVIPLSGQSTSSGELPSLAAVNTFVLSAQSISSGSFAAGILSPISASGASTSITSSASILATLRPTASGQSNSTTSSAAIFATLVPTASGQSNSAGTGNIGLIIRVTGSGQSNATGSLVANRAVGISGTGAAASFGSGAVIATLAPTMIGQANSTGTFAPTIAYKPILSGQSNSTGIMRIGLISPGSSTATSYAYGSAAIGLVIGNNSATGQSTSEGSSSLDLALSSNFIGWGSPL